MRVLGQFRDLDLPDWFVWLRGFRGMSDRTRALGAFYHGTVWTQHRDAANATMIDSDDVLLLKPAPSVDAQWEPEAPPALVEIAARALSPGDEERALQHVHERLLPAGGEAGVLPVAVLVTEAAPHGFPALPVREGGSVVATVLGFRDAGQQRRYRELIGPQDGETQVLHLAPTVRSRLGARHPPVW
jgi:hypothetical protein